MAETFDSAALAKTLVDQFHQLGRVDADWQKDPLANAGKDGKLESQIADKIRAELDPLWEQPEKLCNLGLAMRDLGATVGYGQTSSDKPGGLVVELNSSTAVPTDFKYQTENLLVKVEKGFGGHWPWSHTPTRVYVGGTDHGGDR